MYNKFGGGETCHEIAHGMQKTNEVESIGYMVAFY